jgi:hypothetical protein
MSYRIVLTAEAKQLLTGIQDRREQGIILARLEQLAESPEQQGKPLRGGLAGYRSIRAMVIGRSIGRPVVGLRWPAAESLVQAQHRHKIQIALALGQQRIH